MSWNLKGSYVETCSCELMCPCNLSFDHGATYDFCRVTLVFDIREGEIEGTDIAGLQGRADRGHAEGDDRGQLAARRVHRRAGDATSSPTSSCRSSAVSWVARWRALAPLVGEMLGVERATIEVARRRAAAQRPRRRRDRLRDRGHRALRRRDGRAGPVRRDVPSCRRPISRWRRRSARGSTPSASSTRARPGLSTSEFSWAA